MATFLYKTRGNSSPESKSRVFFTCHPDDFSKYFEKICEDVFKTHDCAIFYTEDLNEEFEEKYKESDLGQMNLFVIPVTFKLLSQLNRAMNSDFRYAQEKHIPVLPIMMESGLDTIYSQNDKFGELQYLDPYSHDLTAIPYEEKLKKYLDSVLSSNEMVAQIRKAFDAYIFLSYRKKDRHYANELMKLIHGHPEFRDVAIWYDEFLTPGESFRKNIEKKMKDSKLFTLLVTPSLLEYVDGKPNFVMANEYPDAKKAGMAVLPIEMEKTDKKDLRSKYHDIPKCVHPMKSKTLRKRLSATLSKIGRSSSINAPEHNYAIGLAYLEGIDVEVDRIRGLTLIKDAANLEFIPAMKKMRELYMVGIAVKADYYEALSWQKKIVLKIESDFNEGICVVTSYIEEMYQLGKDYEKVGRLKDSYDIYAIATTIGLRNLRKMLSDVESIDLIVNGCLKTGGIAYSIKKTEEALQWYNHAKIIVDTLKENLDSLDDGFDVHFNFLMIDVLVAFSKIYQSEADFEKAEANITNALMQCQNLIKLEAISAFQKISIGFVYITSAEIAFDMCDYARSEKKYKAAVSLFDSIYKETGKEVMKETLVSLYHRLSLVAHFLVDFDLKEYYENKAKELSNQSKNLYDDIGVDAKKRKAKELYDQGKYQESFEIYMELADCGEASVLKNLAFMYRLGYGVEKNIQEAIALYEKAIATGDGAAASALGLLYKDGSDVERNEQIALDLFKRAMELGDFTGRLLYQALKSKLDYEESKKTVKRYSKPSEELSVSDACKKILDIVVEKEIVSLLLDTESKIAYLVRQDGRAIDKFDVWAWGWGDSTSFDLWAENETLLLKEASFCHYDRFTEMTIYKYRKIATEEIAVEISHEENVQGRQILSIPATSLLGN